MSGALVAAVALAVLAGAGPAAAAPPIRDLTVVERPGAPIPARLALTDSGGRAVRLGEVVAGRTPVVLALAYARCPSLCNLVLRGLADAVRTAALAPGRDYRIVIVSLDPDETTAEAAARLAAATALAGRSEGWTYLRGTAAAIDALADAVGFPLERDPRSGQIAHPAALIIVGGEGVVRGYLHGLRYQGALDAALAAARAGAAVAPSGGGLLACFQFEPSTRRYARVLALYYGVGAVLTCVLAAAGLSLLVRRRRRSP